MFFSSNGYFKKKQWISTGEWVPCPCLPIFNDYFYIKLSLYIMAIWVVEFSNRGTKLERFFHKNCHTKRKILNFDNWINGASEVFKNQSFKNPLFSSSQKKKSNWNHGLILMIILFFIGNVKNLRQFTKKNSTNRL